MKAGFRFLFSYSCFYLFEMIISIFFSSYKNSYNKFWQSIVLWINNYTFHLEIPFQLTGSGDTTYKYCLLGIYLVLSIVITIFWSILDRKKENYHRLYICLKYVVRVCLAATLISYGLAKIIPPYQFGSLEPYDLIAPYGDSSPMGILWKFMATSRPYTLFVGLLEVLVGFILIIPPLSTLGAFLSVGVMTNIFMLNMCYDVPVKLFSFHLLLMSLFLIDWNALKPILIAKGNRVALTLQIVLIFTFFGRSVYSSLPFSSHEKHPLYGIWSVEGNDPWTNVVLVPPYGMLAQSTTGKWDQIRITYEENKLNFAEKTVSYELEGETLRLDGDFKATLHKINKSDFLLLKRGFHFITEIPLNH